MQVLDRWHVLKNLREAIERLLARHEHLVLQLSRQPEAASVSPAPRAEKERQQQQVSLGKCQARFEQIHHLHKQGRTIKAIAHELGVSREAVWGALRADTPPVSRRNRRRKTALDPFEPYLQKRWCEGCRNARQLWRELREQGYTGCRNQVMRWAQARRAPHERRPKRLGSAGTAPCVQRPSRREIAWWFMLEVTRLSKEANVWRTA
jgi:transposase